MGNCCESHNHSSKIVPHTNIQQSTIVNNQEPQIFNKNDVSNQSEQTVTNDKNNFLTFNKIKDKIQNRASTVRESKGIYKRRTSEGGKILNCYKLHYVLGQGSYGKVKLASKKKPNEQEDQFFAIKILKKSLLKRQKNLLLNKKKQTSIVSNALDDVRREIVIMKKINHKNIIKLYEVIEDDQQDKIIMVMEYAKGGQIVRWDPATKNFSINKQSQIQSQNSEQKFINESQLREYFRQCLLGIHYPDFGVSDIIQSASGEIEQTQGTYHFMAPEALQLNTKSGYNGQKYDIWAIGVTFYCMTYLVLPFNGDTPKDIMDSILKSKLNIPSNPPMPNSFKDLLRGILQKDPNKRFTIQQIANNKWINEGQSNLWEIILKQDKDEELLQQQSINENISVQDINEALIPISRVVFLKNMLKNWKKRSSMSHSQTNSPKKESPFFKYDSNIESVLEANQLESQSSSSSSSNSDSQFDPIPVSQNKQGYQLNILQEGQEIE